MMSGAASESSIGSSLALNLNGQVERPNVASADCDCLPTYISSVAVAYVVTNEAEWELAKDRLLDGMGVTNVIGLDVEFLNGFELQPSDNRQVFPDIPNDGNR